MAESTSNRKQTERSWTECMNAFYVHAVRHPALHTGGIKMNIWGLLLLCKHIDGLQILEILKLKKEWQNYKMIYLFIDAILFSTAQRLVLRV